MPDAILTVFKLCLLALLYLFFLRVLRAVWVEVRSEGNDGDSRERAAGSGRPRSRPETPQPNMATETRRVPPGQRLAGPRSAGNGRDTRVARTPGEPAVLSAPRDIIVTNEAGQRSRPIAIGSLVTVGRAENCEIRINDSFSSQMHARIFDHDGVNYLEDLNSTNGTFLNDAKVSSTAPLHAGDLIQIGNTTLELQ